jgi:hypothetical protein
MAMPTAAATPKAQATAASATPAAKATATAKAAALTKMKKEELVLEFSKSTGIPREEAEAMRKERLILLLRAIRDNTPGQAKLHTLPKGYRKYTKGELVQLYHQVFETEYLEGTRVLAADTVKEELILRLEMWAAESDEEEDGTAAGAALPGPMRPVCPTCQVPMIIRKNRLTGGLFNGCPTFPTCRLTLPYVYAGHDTAVMQERLSQDRRAQGNHSTASEASRRRGTRRNLVSSEDGSFQRIDVEDNEMIAEVRNLHMNLTEDEVARILQARQTD